MEWIGALANYEGRPGAFKVHGCSTRPRSLL